MFHSPSSENINYLLPHTLLIFFKKSFPYLIKNPKNHLPKAHGQNFSNPKSAVTPKISRLRVN